jgi:endonuclease YncB( thermonuclease family)
LFLCLCNGERYASSIHDFKISKKKGGAGQPFSQKSKKYLAGLVLNKVVDIKDYGTHRYGRTLGVVYVDGVNINLEMVKAGLAEIYRGNVNVLIKIIFPILRKKLNRLKGKCGL